MIKFIVPALSLLIVATPALADDRVPTTFTRDGETYQYTVKEEKNATYITGIVTSTGEHFSLKVAKGEVVGDFSGNPVSFTTAEATTPQAVAAR